MAGAEDLPLTRSTTHRGRAALVALGLVAVLTGGSMVATSALSVEEAGPLPSETFSVAPTMLTPASPAASEKSALTRDQVSIPSLGVKAPLVSTNVYSNLPEVDSVGWDVASDAHARKGSVLLAGHVSSHGTPGALHHLSEIKPGALVYLSDADGKVTVWAVNSLQVHVKADLPRGLATKKGDRRLVIVTCGGPVIQRDDGLHYRDNVVVYAVPAD